MLVNVQFSVVKQTLNSALGVTEDSAVSGLVRVPGRLEDATNAPLSRIGMTNIPDGVPISHYLIVNDSLFNSEIEIGISKDAQIAVTHKRHPRLKQFTELEVPLRFAVAYVADADLAANTKVVMLRRVSAT